MRITRALPTECDVCHGLGYTAETADVMETRRDKEYGIVETKTIRKGCGCPKCLGLGQVLAKGLRTQRSH